jgi:hypothetical protein
LIFFSEPGGNPALAGYDNVFMLPHIGSSTGPQAMQWDLERLIILTRFLPESSRTTFHKLPPLTV